MILCLIFITSCVTAIAQQTEGSNKPTTNGLCKLPPYPKNGNYTAVGNPEAEPGQAFEYVALNITCNTGYLINGKEKVQILCVNGIWTEQITDCNRSCRLIKDSSVRYRCLLEDDNGTRECKDQEPDGTVVRPECNMAEYYTFTPLPYMRCFAGSWDYVAKCTAECGRLVPKSVPLLLHGNPKSEEGMPWNAAIYRKSSKSHIYICGGTLVRNNVVISAGHCFWNTQRHMLESPEGYTVVVGNLFRAFNHSRDVNSQISDVSEIKVSPYFQGPEANYQDDIAVVVLAKPVQFNVYVRPACLDFDAVFEERQLRDGTKGTVAGWDMGKIQKLVDVPLLPLEQCISEVPRDFRPFITGDKICVGSKNGPTGICRGFGGAGLAFPQTERGIVRYYLRGVVSGAPQTENCTHFINTVTQISKHEVLIKSLVKY